MLTSPVSIIEGEGSGETRCRHSKLHSLTHNLSPAVLKIKPCLKHFLAKIFRFFGSNLAGVDCISEEVVKKEIVETWVLVKCCLDVAQESEIRF